MKALNLACLFGVSVTLLLAGCGEGKSGPAEVSGAKLSPPKLNLQPGPTGQPAGATADTSTPDKVVAHFYDALRDGNEQTIAALLTDKAREETAKSGLDIRSPGSASLTYEIGEIDYVTEAGDGAHVKSLWMQPDENGEKFGTEVIWVLRRQSNGWRIAGMATQVQEGQLPLLFNFEEPEDMLAKKEYVETELQAAEQSAGDDTSIEQLASPQGIDAPATTIR